MGMKGSSQVVKQRDLTSNRAVCSGSYVPWACLLALFATCFFHHKMTTAQDTDPLAVLVEVLQTTDDAGVQASLLKGMLHGLEGQRNVRAPKGWGKVSGKLMKSDDRSVRTMTLQLGQIFGDPQAIKFMLATVWDSKAEVQERRSALKALLLQQNRQVLGELESLLDEPAMRLDAIRAYGHAGTKDRTDTARTVRDTIYLQGGGKSLLVGGPSDIEQVAFSGLPFVIEQVNRSGCIDNGLWLNAAVGCFLKVHGWTICQ